MVLRVTTTVPREVHDALTRLATGLGYSLAKTTLRVISTGMSDVIERLEEEGDKVFQAAVKAASEDREYSMREFIREHGGRLEENRRPTGTSVKRITVVNDPSVEWEVKGIAVLAWASHRYNSASKGLMYCLRDLLKITSAGSQNEAVRLVVQDLLETR